MQKVVLQPEHIGLAAQDPAGLSEWYVSKLGARVVFHNGASPPAVLLSLAGACWVEIYPAERAPRERAENSRSGWRHLALRVEDLCAAQAELTARGVAFEGEVRPAGGGGRVLFFRDAEGNLLHLVERSGSTLTVAP